MDPKHCVHKSYALPTELHWLEDDDDLKNFKDVLCCYKIFSDLLLYESMFNFSDVNGGQTTGQPEDDFDMFAQSRQSFDQNKDNLK